MVVVGHAIMFREIPLHSITVDKAAASPRVFLLVWDIARVHCAKSVDLAVVEGWMWGWLKYVFGLRLIGIYKTSLCSRFTHPLSPLWLMLCVDSLEVVTSWASSVVVVMRVVWWVGFRFSHQLQTA